MTYDTAGGRLLVWLTAAAVGWAVLLGVVLYLPESIAGLAVAGFLLWRKGRRPVPLTVPAELVAATPVPATAPVATTPTTVARSRDDARHLVAHPV